MELDMEFLRRPGEIISPEPPRYCLIFSRVLPFAAKAVIFLSHEETYRGHHGKTRRGRSGRGFVPRQRFRVYCRFRLHRVLSLSYKEHEPMTDFLTSDILGIITVVIATGLFLYALTLPNPPSDSTEDRKRP
jgi:hypothetical protein